MQIAMRPAIRAPDLRPGDVIGTVTAAETTAEGAAKAAGVPLAGVDNTLEEALNHGLGMVLAPVAMDSGALNTGIVGTNPLESLQSDNSAR